MDNKYEKLKFSSDVEKTEVRQALLSRKKIGIKAMAVINGFMIYNTSDTLDEDIERAFKRLNENDYSKLQELQNDLSWDYRILENLDVIEDDALFKYYFNLMRKMVKNECLEAFNDEMLRNYRYYASNYGALRLASSMMLLLYNSGQSSFNLELNNILMMFDNGANRQYLDIAIQLVKNYSRCGEEIENLLAVDLCNEIKVEQEAKIKVKENKLREFVDSVSPLE